ncbi:phosphoribosylglycinamide formyltransferase [Reichenbachiella ulvae]|uniref:Phosphoribosylglycinamide formyltransferase n=1 Tax=Reichenbachiella ulvae TaxID=2980104 RepID=A0ABT3CYI6_9BACT|nr:phosphoribosylglycinamide formyltransferase [Reichenbachiella ulvae]MCV9388613.1 phosphoribosylglycinamide formyltransferase [Reichenbachiella ulvae]
MSKIKLAIFASGSGTNAEQISKHFAQHNEVEVSLILSNKKKAFVLERAKNLGIESHTFDRPTFYESEEVLELLKKNQIDFIILAGFLWLVPPYLIQAYRDKMINVHPALLPKFGGKGMYGDKVHQAVIAQQEEESGITIHLVDEIYDNGKILRQASVQIDPSDDPESLAQKIHALEYEHFPKAIEEYVLSYKA